MLLQNSRKKRKVKCSVCGREVTPVINGNHVVCPHCGAVFEDIFFSSAYSGGEVENLLSLKYSSTIRLIEHKSIMKYIEFAVKRVEKAVGSFSLQHDYHTERRWSNFIDERLGRFVEKYKKDILELYALLFLWELYTPFFKRKFGSLLGFLRATLGEDWWRIGKKLLYTLRSKGAGIDSKTFVFSGVSKIEFPLIPFPPNDVPFYSKTFFLLRERDYCSIINTRRPRLMYYKGGKVVVSFSTKTADYVVGLDFRRLNRFLFPLLSLDSKAVLYFYLTRSGEWRGLLLIISDLPYALPLSFSIHRAGGKGDLSFVFFLRIEER